MKPTLGNLLDATQAEMSSVTDEAILGEALMSRSCADILPDLLERLKPEDFSTPYLGEAWRKAQTLQEAGKLVSRRNLIRDESADFKQKMSELAGRAPDPIYVSKAAEIVEGYSQRRRIARLSYDIASFAGSAASYAEALSFAQSAIEQMAATSEDPDGPRSFQDAVEDWWDWIEAPPEEVRIFPTPWNEVNEKLSGGFHAGRTYVAAGRPGSGKSLMITTALQHIAEQGHPSLLYSVEMKERELVSRLMASGAEAEYGHITKRELTDTDLSRLGIYSDNRVPDTKLWILDDPRLKIEQVYSFARQMKKTVGLDVLALDYIQIIEPTDSRQTRERQVAHLSRMTQVIAKSLDVAVILAAQLNRGPEMDSTPPKLSDLRESDALGHDADVALLLHHDEEEGIPTGEVEVHLGKNRTGPRDVIIPLPFRPHYARIG